MEKPKFRTYYNGIKPRQPFKTEKKSDGKVITMPGDALTIKEMIERHQSGIDQPEEVTHYFDMEDLDKRS